MLALEHVHMCVWGCVFVCVLVCMCKHTYLNTHVGQMHTDSLNYRISIKGRNSKSILFEGKIDKREKESPPTNLHQCWLIVKDCQFV